MTRRWQAGVLAVVVGAWIAPPAARTALNVTHGLATQSFSNQNQSGTRSFGYLAVPRQGRYRFAVSSAAPAILQVDGRPAADTSGAPAPGSPGGDLILDRGPHFILIESAHDGVAPPVELSWAREDGPLGALPFWALSPARVDPWKVTLVRGLEWVRAAVVLLAALAAGRAAFSRWRTPAAAALRLHPRIATLLLFAALTVVQTWPLASDPAHLSRHDNSDAMLNEWTLGWVAHQSLRDPVRLFDANVFFPERRTLAYSEAMLVQGALGAPLFWAGAGSLLVYNLVLLAGFTLTGWSTCLVAARWTGDWIAGILAGILAAFNAHTLTRLPHLQALHVEFLPPALAALDVLLREPRARHALRLAGWFALQSLASIYLLVFSAFALTAAALVRPREWLGARFPRVAVHVILAAVAAALALLPYLLPYWHVYTVEGASRPLGDVALYAASWGDYMSSPSRMHFAAWSHRWFTGAALFPGFVALALGALAVVSGRAWSDPRARMCLAVAVCGVLLSFGTKLPGYAALYDALPLLRAVRAVSRFGYLGLMGLAFLAGFGIVELRRRLPSRAWGPAAAALVTLAAAEPLVAPIHFSRFDRIPAIYDTIAGEPGVVVAELPMPGGFGWFGNARYMLNSTRHWKPMLNGYSGFAPPSFHEHAAALADFPQDASVAALQDIGVTHVFVHLAGYTAGQRAVMDRAPALTRIAEDDRIVLYRVASR